MSERRAHRYRVVDVFTEAPLEGNPVAFFPASADLGPRVMQAIARELRNRLQRRASERSGADALAAPRS